MNRRGLIAGILAAAAAPAIVRAESLMVVRRALIVPYFDKYDMSLPDDIDNYVWHIDPEDMLGPRGGPTARFPEKK